MWTVPFPSVTTDTPVSSTTEVPTLQESPRTSVTQSSMVSSAFIPQLQINFSSSFLTLLFQTANLEAAQLVTKRSISRNFEIFEKNC